MSQKTGSADGRYKDGIESEVPHYMPPIEVLSLALILQRSQYLLEKDYPGEVELTKMAQRCRLLAGRIPNIKSVYQTPSNDQHYTKQYLDRLADHFEAWATSERLRVNTRSVHKKETEQALSYLRGAAEPYIEFSALVDIDRYLGVSAP